MHTCPSNRKVGCCPPPLTPPPPPSRNAELQVRVKELQAAALEREREEEGVQVSASRVISHHDAIMERNVAHPRRHLHMHTMQGAAWIRARPCTHCTCELAHQRGLGRVAV